MMNGQAKYVLDANTFIQPRRRFYPFDICPGYWDALIWHHTQGSVCSIDRVAAELERGGDDLWAWAESQLPGDFFVSTDDSGVIACYAEALAWVQAQDQFLPTAKAEFAEADRADAWLVAYAKKTGRVLVTLEEYDPLIRKKVPMPNVCRAMGVEYIKLFDMLRRLDAQFNWHPPS